MCGFTVPSLEEVIFLIQGRIQLCISQAEPRTGSESMLKGTATCLGDRQTDQEKEKKKDTEAEIHKDIILKSR